MDEIKKYILSEKLNDVQKCKIAVSYMMFLYGEGDIYAMLQIKKCVKEYFVDNYSYFETNWTVNLSEEDRYRLWTDEREIIENDCSYYLFENLLKDDIAQYDVMFDIKRLSTEKIINGLIDNLKKIGSIDNLPTFKKVYHHISTIIKVDGKCIDNVIDLCNPVFNVVLWHMDKIDTFDFETLRTKFIYFRPKDQVRIVKKLFMLAEMKKLTLTIEMLETLVRVDRSLFEYIAKSQPEIPVDFSVDVVIKSLSKYSKEHRFFYDKEIYDIMVFNLSLNDGKYRDYDFNLKDFFDKCDGRKYYEKKVKVCDIPYKTGLVRVFENHFEIFIRIWYYTEKRTYFSKYNYKTKCYESDFFTNKVRNKSMYIDKIINEISLLQGKKVEGDNEQWIVLIDDNNIKEIKRIANQYNMVIQGTNEQVIQELKNIPIEYEYVKTKVPQRQGICFCEGRSALNTWEEQFSFNWCGNAMCFDHQVVEHSVEEWEKYTMYDFCRILGLNTDKNDTQGRLVKNGDYLAFVSIVNRMNYMLDHLKCRECGQMLMPNEISNYLTHMVTRFKCTTSNCSEYGKVYYISKCFNWKCYEIIDQREIKRCPNGWFICKNCGSCCSTRIVKQRVDNCLKIGINPSQYLLDFAERNLGHLEKREFYCHKCGQQTEYKYDHTTGVYVCPICGVTYERWKYDYKDLSITKDY